MPRKGPGLHFTKFLRYGIETVPQRDTKRLLAGILVKKGLGLPGGKVGIGGGDSLNLVALSRINQFTPCGGQ